MHVLNINNITFNYPHNPNLFENVSFTIDKGESLRLEGTNGSGKTTILNCIAQFRKINSGDILFEDKSIIKKQPYQLWKLGVRRLIADKLVFDNMTVEENLLLSHKKSDIQDVINVVPCLNDLLKRNAMKLSGGEKMLVALSMILNTNAKLLILDEPFNALAPNNKIIIINLLNDLKKDGVSILLVDHGKCFETDKIYKLN